jgi:ABC-type Zn uptake system ZnuABC Zn-binding protein ZnuA
MKNKKMLLSTIILIMIPLLFFSVSEVHSAEKPVIVCTTTAVGSVVESLVGNNAEVLVLVQPGLCPADFDIKPGYVDAISKASILFKQNIKGEFWLDNLLESAGNQNLSIVAIPGVYNTPEGAKKYILGIGGNLSQILKLDLDLQITQMLAEIDEISSWMKNQAQNLEVSKMKVICMSWLKTFIESTGFNVVTTYNPPETLSAKDIAILLQTARAENVGLIVDNLQIDVEFGEGIASQVGAEHLVLTNFPGAIPGTETLPKMLKYNAEQLFKGTSNWQLVSALNVENNDLKNEVAIFQISTSVALIIIIVEAVLIYIKRKK